MARKRFKAEQIVMMLREVELQLAKGVNLDEACRSLGFSTHSYYRWRKEYGGLNVSQAKRLKELERENARLRQAVSDLTLDKLILQEAARGNF
jgi:putative transposase